MKRDKEPSFVCTAKTSLPNTGVCTSPEGPRLLDSLHGSIAGEKLTTLISQDSSVSNSRKVPPRPHEEVGAQASEVIGDIDTQSTDNGITEIVMLSSSMQSGGDTG